jgi:TetR/AcrR family transcriptional regulator, mexJK operon transcriptional repressor
MPLQRDDREFESKRQQIIDGALDVFATKGFENATNKDIARASKIGSPALIYHYFQDKADLFREVIEQRTQLFQLLTHSDAIMELPPREALAQFGEAFVGVLNNRAAVSVFRLMLGEATRRPAVAEMINKVGPGRLFPLLRRYFERQMDIGVMRRMDSGGSGALLSWSPAGLCPHARRFSAARCKNAQPAHHGRYSNRRFPARRTRTADRHRLNGINFCCDR